MNNNDENVQRLEKDNMDYKNEKFKTVLTDESKEDFQVKIETDPDVNREGQENNLDAGVDKEFEKLVSSTNVNDAMARAEASRQPVTKNIFRKVGNAVSDKLMEWDSKIINSSPIFSVPYCATKAVAYNLTHDMTAEYLRDKYNLTSASSQKDKDAYDREYDSLKISTQVKQAMRKGRGPVKIIYGAIALTKALMMKLAMKGHNLHQRMDDYASGKTIKIEDPKKFYDEKEKFITEEKQAVLDYNALKRAGKDQQVEAILKARNMSLDDMVKKIMTQDFVSENSRKEYLEYKKYVAVDQLTQEKMEKNYSDAEYYQKLNSLGVRLEELKENDMKALKEDNYDYLKYRSEKDSFARDLMFATGGMSAYYNPDDIPLNQTSDLSDNGLLKTSEIDNHVASSKDIEMDM